MKKQVVITLCLLLTLSAVRAAEVTISSLEELALYAARSGNTISMKPGIYKLTDYLTRDSISARRERKAFQYITFSGSNNNFNLEGVEIEVDTELRTALKPPIHSDEFLVTGTNNSFVGLTIRCIGEGTSPGGTVLQVAGSDNVLRDVTLHVAGSYPYGYGDLFGKGKRSETTISHKKHSGLLVTGDRTKLYRCKVLNRSFGHCFFVQQHPEDVYFEDCYAEGEVRSTDEVLAETSGPAYDVNFKTWTQNREGEYIVTPGYMKSLCEDGFRTYGACQNITFKNCTAKNTRAGFELRGNSSARLENCITIGTERAYWVGDNAVVKNCRGDANYGPLMFLEGSNVEVELILDPAESDRVVHSLITILGENNKVVLKSDGKKKSKELPILIGYTPPLHGESMSPYSEEEAVGLTLENETGMPISIGSKAKDCEIATNGEVLESKGSNIQISKR